MRDTAEVRRANENRVRRALWAGGVQTKEEVARATGLSVPTVSSLLNALAETGEVIGTKRSGGGVGRAATEYRVDERVGTVIALGFEVAADGTRRLHAELLSVLGSVLDVEEVICDLLTYEHLRDAVLLLEGRAGDVREVVIGAPAIVVNGALDTCDAAELDGVDVVGRLAADTGAVVLAHNDMHLKAYGCYRTCAHPGDVVTLANFPVRILPGTATVSEGRVLRGAHRFAGMVGFIDYGMDREVYRKRLVRPQARSLIAQGLTAVIAAQDPSLIVCTGELLDEGELCAVEELVAKSIPAPYLPRFEYREDLDDLFRAGMLACALDARTGEHVLD